MADLRLSDNRGGVFVPVTVFPAGITDDSVFGITYLGQKYIRNKTGPVTIKDADIQADGVTDQTARLNTVLALAKIKSLDFEVDGGGEVLVTGTVTVPAGKILNIKAGTKIKTTGAGLVTGGIVDADPYQEIFTGTRNVKPTGSTRNYISANWYGVNMVGYTQTTNADNANLAAQIIINSDTLPQNLHFPEPTYSFNKPIQLYKWDSINSLYVQHYIELSGNSEGAMQGRGTTFYFDCPTAFGIGIHIGKGCIIRNLKIIGTFAPTWANMKAFVETTQANYGAGSGCLDGRYATNGGVVIDYLRGDVPPDGGYTTILSQYRGSTTSSSGSTKCEILNCTISNWITGVGFSINGQTQNCDSMVVADSCVQGCKWTFSFGQDQTRNCWLRNILCWDSTFCFVTNSIHGNQSGAPPSIDNVSLAGQINQFAHVITGGRSGFGATKVFCESIYRIGLIAGEPSSIRDFEFDFMMVAGVHAGIPAPDLYATLSKVTMSDGRMRNYDNNFDKRMHMAAANCKFHNVRFDLPPLLPTQTNGNDNTFDECTYGGSLGIPLGLKGTIVANDQTIGYVVQHGKFTVTDLAPDSTQNNITYKSEYDFPADYEIRGGLGSLAVTVDVATRTATFTSTDFALVGHIGEYITTDTAVASFDDPAYLLPVAVIGRVTGYAANVVTVSEVPVNIATGTFDLYVSAYKTIGYPFMGDLSVGSPTITNLEYGTFPPYVGQRLTGGGGAKNSQGVYTNYTIVKSVNLGAKTVTISIGAMVTKKDVAFVSAKKIVVYSNLLPSHATLNSLAYPMYEGTEFVSQLQQFSDGRIQTLVHKIIKGGHLNQGTVGSIRQAEWALEVPLRANGANLERMDLTAGTWSAVQAAITVQESIAGAGTSGNPYAVAGLRKYTTTNRDLISPKFEGMTIWNITTQQVETWNAASAWSAAAGASNNYVLATDANTVVNASTDFIELPEVTANRTLTLPAASGATRPVEIWNRNTHATFNWAFAVAVTLPDGNTSTLLPRNYITKVRNTADEWVNVYPALVGDSTIGGSGSEADPLHVDSVRSFATGDLPASGNDGQIAYDETVDKLKVRQSGAWTAQT